MGLFYSFDGIDGVGKTTQIDLFRGFLESRGETVVVCRDPGSSPLGEQIRAILLNSTDLRIDNLSEMLLYMAARAQLVQEVIQPALARGQSVISDRFLLANVVYQGHAGGLDPEQIWQVGHVATGGLLPEMTFVLDLDPLVAASRRTGEPDRVEGRGNSYLSRVRDGFLAEASRHPRQIVVIDASRSPDEVHQAVRAACPPRTTGEGL